MDPLKKELYDQHQKQIKDATLKMGLLCVPGMLAFLAFILYFKPAEGDIGLLIALYSWILYILIVSTPYLIKLIKLRKEYEQQIAELDAEE